MGQELEEQLGKKYLKRLLRNYKEKRFDLGKKIELMKPSQLKTLVKCFHFPRHGQILLLMTHTREPDL